MKLSPKEYAQALFEAISETASSSEDLIVERFLKILINNGDIGKWPDIEKEFVIFQTKAKGETPATINFAREHKINSELVESLNNVANKKFSLHSQVEEKIIGGIILRSEDLLIDGSLKTQLEELKSNLIK
jgi:F-type H+-transporting ATPase subunit delta